jgi:pseudouridine synthase
VLEKNRNNVKERVQKLMAQANIGSRRACEELISQGRVRVNGVVITLGAKADPTSDTIEVDGEKLPLSNQPKIYVALNKPKDVLSTSLPHKDDPRPTVYDFIPMKEHLFTIGRLDADSDGLIVLTNDGELVQKLTHPSYRHTKKYKVVVYGLPTAETIAKWEKGVSLGEDGITSPCLVRITDGDKSFSTLEIVMTEGKKRQIRRVAAILDHPVRHLTRTHIGKLGLGTLRPGDWRELNAEDIEALKQSEPQARAVRPAGRRPFSPRGPRKDDRRGGSKPPRRRTK